MTIYIYIYIQVYIYVCVYVFDSGPQNQSLGYICDNSQKYTVWVKIFDLYFMPKIIRTISKDHVPVNISKLIF